MNANNISFQSSPQEKDRPTSVLEEQQQMDVKDRNATKTWRSIELTSRHQRWNSSALLWHW